MRRILTGIILTISLAFYALRTTGQEMVGHINWNPALFNNHISQLHRAARTTAATLTLPFFEDFTGYSPVPDSNKWMDAEVYINNTMCVSPVSRGVATFDGLNALGIPYDSFSNTSYTYADSLTSQAIDLSGDSVGDSVYLSFFYQPQGNGFFPNLADSLELYLKNRYGDFVLVWSVPGTTLQPFQQVMIPITDTLDFHNSFQFRFVNIAALNWADAIWNVDYIRLDKNRNINDTVITDVAYTSNPSFLLNDYTSMPYNQFMANTASEITSQVTDSIRNNTPIDQTMNYSSVIYDAQTGAILSVAGPTNTTVAAGSTEQALEPWTIGSYPSYPAYTSVVFKNEFYLQTPTAVGPTVNDTIIGSQVFDNYLAYDDGSAEKSYYLNLSTSLPGKIAIEYHLNTPDTLRGLSIYFGRQIPFPFEKLFAIYIYTALQHINGAPNDVTIDSTDLLIPGYADSNHFWNYAINPPLLLPAGTFYAGILLPLGGQSDSLYFGLDVNRVGPNHAYYNVENLWVPSAISGAIMIRPLLGHAVASTGIPEVGIKNDDWLVYPNPADNVLNFKIYQDAPVDYNVTDIQGRMLMHGSILNNGSINIAGLSQGMYFVNIIKDGIPATPQKFIKL